MNTHAFLDRIEIAKPCPANWDEMTGDERARFCQHCRKNVYNLSAMTAEEAVALVRAKEGKLCVRLYRRRDGTVLTSDCPVGVREYYRRVRRSVAMAAATFLALLTGGRDSQAHSTFKPPVRELKGKVALPTMGVAIMGDIAPPPPPPATNPPPPSVTGRIVVH